MILSPDSILKIGLDIRTDKRSTQRNQTIRFKTVYGTHPSVVYDIWLRLVALNEVDFDDNKKVKRFFLCLTSSGTIVRSRDVP